MNSGLYAACAGLLAQSQALDLAANNLANVNTTGYKGQFPSFRSILANSSSGSSAVARAVNDFGVLGDSRTSLLQGNLEHTGSDLDFALDGQGWFAVDTSNGRLYTRNGNFHVDTKGRLVTADGSPVVGAQGPVTIASGKLSVSADGTISVDGVLAGQLQVVNFPADAELTPVGGSYFAAPAGSQTKPGAGKVVQGALENSNVNGISAAVGLVSLQRRADMLQQALTAFHSNFNRIAAQDLSRI